MATVYVLTRITLSGHPSVAITTSVAKSIATLPPTQTQFLNNAPTLLAVAGALSNISTDPAGQLGQAAGALGQGQQFENARKTLTADNYRSCGLCPDSLVNTISAEVQEVMDMVLRVKCIVRTLNRVLEGAERTVIDFLNGFIDLIPAPPIFDLRELVRMLMCPLLFQSYGISVYQKAITSAHRVASNTVPFGSLNPGYYPVLAQMTTKYFIEDSVRLVSGAVESAKQLWVKLAKMWADMAREFWRRFMLYIDEQNPFTDFGSGGRQSTDGTTNSGSASNFGNSFLRVGSLSDVKNPVEGMVVYIESSPAAPQFSGEERTQYHQYSTSSNPDAGLAARKRLSPEDQIAQNIDTGVVRRRQRYVYRDRAWVPLADSSMKRLVKTIFRLLMELWGVIRNAGYFSVRAAVTKGSVALVRATCPAVYNSDAYPFKRFDVLMRDFRMEGFVPSGLGSSSRPFAEVGLRLIIKIEAWAAASFITLV